MTVPHMRLNIGDSDFGFVSDFGFRIFKVVKFGNLFTDEP